jgi:hypothetical protein
VKTPSFYAITLENVQKVKVSRFIVPVIFSGILLTSQAQEATTSDLQTKESEDKNQPAPPPEPNLPELSRLDESFKPSSLGKEAEDLRVHVEWRRLANQVEKDPEIVAAKKSTESTRTDLEKRQRLRSYYNIYYAKMRALASSAELKAMLDASKTAHLSYINQPRVRHLTDAALPTPTPQRIHGHGKK